LAVGPALRLSFAIGFGTVLRTRAIVPLVVAALAAPVLRT
jgi:hypothetical protein